MAISRTITTNKTIQKLRELFARFGLPVTIVSDNGPQFTSQEFRSFLQSNGICHKLTATYHPSTNGQAERYVQTIKKGLKAMAHEPGNIQLKLCRLLMQYRKVPNVTTQQSPANLLLRINLRTRLDLIRPDLVSDMRQKQEEHYEQNLKHRRELQPRDKVLVRNYTGKEKWNFGIIIRKLGFLHYLVNVDGKVLKRHVDQLKLHPWAEKEAVSLSNHENEETHWTKPSSSSTDFQLRPLPAQPVMPNEEQPRFTTPEAKTPSHPEGETPTGEITPEEMPQQTTEVTTPNQEETPPLGRPPLYGEADRSPQLRRSGRTRKPPERLQYF